MPLGLPWMICMALVHISLASTTKSQQTCKCGHCPVGYMVFRQQHICNTNMTWSTKAVLMVTLSQ